MPILRPYVDSDWEAVLDLCLLALTPACESLERMLGGDLDWRTSLTGYLCSLTGTAERRRLVVAEVQGRVVGFVHYQVDREAQSGSLGVSAVHPSHQGRGIGTLLYNHVLHAMWAQGLKCATAEAGGELSDAPVRRAYEKVGFVAVPTVHYFMELGHAHANLPPRDAGRPRRARPRQRTAGRAATVASR